MHQLYRLAQLRNDVDLALAQAGMLSGYVIVQNKSDFPVPAGGIIQLADNTIYQVNGSISLTTDRLVMGTGTVLTGNDNSKDILTYTGTDALVSAAGGNDLRVKELTLVATTGAMFDAEDATIVALIRVFGQALRVGRFEDCVSVILQEGSITGLESGFELINATPGVVVAILNTRLSQHAGAIGAIVDFGTSVWSQIQMIVIQLISAVAGTDITGLSANGNLGATGRARMFGSIVDALGTHLVGITEDDLQWQFHNNIGLVNSVAVGSVNMTGNAVVTDIVTQNIFVKVAGTTVLNTAKRFDAGNPADDNNLRLTALSPANVEISTSGTATKSGASKVYVFQVFKNGSAIGIPIAIMVGNQVASASFSFVDEATVGDEFDLRVANTEDTDDLTVTALTMDLIGF